MHIKEKSSFQVAYHKRDTDDPKRVFDSHNAIVCMQRNLNETLLESEF